MKRCPLLLPIVCALLVMPAHADTLAVDIAGLEGEMRDNVRASLGMERRKGEGDLTPETIDAQYRRAVPEIRGALEPFGRYRPEIADQLAPPAEPGGQWQARFKVDPGPQVHLGAVTVRVTGAGETDAELRAFMESQPLRKGEPFDHRGYEKVKNDWLRFARRRGYLDALYALHRVEVSPDQALAAVELELDSGPRYRFGSVTFEQEGFSEHYLQSYLAFHSGDPFDADQLQAARRALSGSGHFDLVEIERQPLDPTLPDEVPLRVKLQNLKPNNYRGQIGYGTDTGIGLKLDWQRRYLGDSGQQLNADGVVVQDRNKRVADIAWLIPQEPLLPRRLEVFGRYAGKDLTYEDVQLTQGGTTRIEDLSAGLRQVGKRQLWGLDLDETLSLAYFTESYDIFQVLFGHLSPAEQKPIMAHIGAEGMTTLAPDFKALVPEVAWSYKRADDPLLPRSGEFLRLEFRGAMEGVGSNLSFWQTHLRSALIRPVRARDRVILRGELGYTDADTKEVLGATFNQMPEYYEFRTGGDRTVRGYEYESLFPSQSITGGKHLLVGSVEYEYALFGDWALAAFYDTGDAFNDFGALDLKQGVGVGARWRSPVGMVRLDVAVPLEETGDAFRIHFTIGPEF